LHSNQPLEQANMNKQPLTGSIKKSELIQILIKECKLKFGVYSAKTLLPQPVFILIDFFLVFTVNNDVIRIIFHLAFDVIRFNKPSHFYLKFHFIIVCLRSLNSHVNRLCCVVNPKVAYVYILHGQYVDEQLFYYSNHFDYDFYRKRNL
jgi:hypothetical protein